MSMEPTNRLRWLRSPVKTWPKPPVLQQLWRTPDIVNYREEWRDVPTEEADQ